MIPFASQRGGGQDLATHLMNEYDNEVAELAQLRGAIAADLHGAFKEWQVQAEDLTRCAKYLYSLSINPDPKQGPLTREQYMDYIVRTEEALGLTNQPRAIVFHEKYGREHCHVVWSRIDAMHGKAVHLAFDHEKLMRVTRAFARDHGLRLPPGYEKSPEKGQESLYDREKQRQTGLSNADHMHAVTRAWQQSDSPRAFVRALSAQGYLLATGKRPYVLVDLYGGTHALARLIDDKAVKTADLRKFLGKDFSPESLPTVEEAIALVEQHRASIDKESAEDERTTALANLRQAHQARRGMLAAERQTLEARHREGLAAITLQQRAARDALRHRHLEQRKASARERRENRPTGLAAFLGRITGVEALRSLLHKRQDAQALAAYGAQILAMKVAQTRACIDQEQKHRAEALEQARREKALTRIERREIVALLRDLRASQRSLARGNSDGLMPTLEGVVRRDRRAQVRQGNMAPTHRAGEAQDALEDAATRSPTELPNLLAAFARATQARRARETTDDKARALDRPPLDRMTRPTRDRDQLISPLERGPEPGRDPGHERD